MSPPATPVVTAAANCRSELQENSLLLGRELVLRGCGGRRIWEGREVQHGSVGSGDTGYNFLRGDEDGPHIVASIGMGDVRGVQGKVGGISEGGEEGGWWGIAVLFQEK